MSTSTSNGSRSAGGSNTKDGSSRCSFTPLPRKDTARILIMALRRPYRSASTNAGDMDLSKKLPLGSYQHKKSAQLVKMLKVGSGGGLDKSSHSVRSSSS
mgnify:CR=1 FL=1|jgi:hypothetical protein